MPDSSSKRPSTNGNGTRSAAKRAPSNGAGTAPRLSPDGVRGPARRFFDHLMLPCALILIALSASQRSYSPKHGIHTEAHITLADILVWVVALGVLLPYLEQTRIGRRLSWAVLAVLVLGGIVFSRFGQDFISIAHKGLHSKSLKPGVEAAAVLAFAGWQWSRLRRWTRAGVEPAPLEPSLVGLSLPIVALFVVVLLSTATMVLPSESLKDLLQSTDTQEPLREAGKYLAQVFGYLGVCFFLFRTVLCTPGRVRVAVRALLVGTACTVLMAVPQYFHYVHSVRRAVAPHVATPLHVEGLLQSRHAYGGFLCLVLPLALGMLLGAKKKPVRIALAGFIALSLVTTLSGPGFWCAVIGLVAASLRFGGKDGIRAAGCCAALVVAILVVFPWNRHLVVNEFLHYRTTPGDAAVATAAAMASRDSASEFKAGPTSDEEAPASKAAAGPAAIRKQYEEWVAGVYMASEHLWLGVGPKQYQLNIGQYYGQEPDPTIRLERDSNNLYTVQLASLGLAGLIVLLQIFLDALGQSWIAGRPGRGEPSQETAWAAWWQSREGRAMAAGLFGAVLALIIVNLFVALLIRGIGIAIAFLLALTAAANSARRAPLGSV